MNHRTPLTLTGLLGLALALTFVLPAATSRADEEEGPLHDAMETINTNFKLLRRQARRLDFDEQSIAWVVEMQAKAVEAMHLEPHKAEKLNGTEKQQFIIGYRKQMKLFIMELMDLEIALLEGRKEDASKHIDALATHKSDGHEKYTDEE